MSTDPTHGAVKPRFCTYCGSPNVPDAKFCRECGKPAGGVTTAAGTPSASVEPTPAAAEAASESEPRFTPPSPPAAAEALPPSSSPTVYPGAVVAYPQAPVSRPCPSCGRDWGDGIACQFCDQVEGVPVGVHLSSSARRLGAHLLDIVLFIFTLGIGWLVWQLIVAKDGQSPGKQLLGMRVVKLRTSTKATWGTMFLREVIVKPLIIVFLGWFFGIVYFWLLWYKNRQELWDKMISTIVVDDSYKQIS